MNSDEKNLRQFVDRNLPSPSQQEMEEDCARVLDQLQSRPAHQQRPRVADLELPHRNLWTRTPLRIAAGFIAIALLLALSFPTLISPDNVYAIVESAGSLYRVADGKTQALNVGDRIGADTPLRTESGAGAVLKLPGGSRIEMRPESEISLEHAQDGLRIRLNDGSVNVTPAKEPAGNLYVQNREQTVPVLAAAVVASQVVEPRLAFEVVSIRPTAGPLPTGERGTGGGVRRRNPRPAAEPCGSGSEPQLDPRRFDVNNSTVHSMITWAYGLDCNDWRGSDLVFGGPAWVKEDGYDMQAVIPEGTPRYTQSQFLENKAPELQKMLQAVLADRFQLAIHREMREIPVYVLLVAPGGPRFVPSNVGKKADAPMITLANGDVVRGPGFGPAPVPGISVWKDGDDDCCGATTPEGIGGTKQPIRHLADMLAFTLGRPVLDRTGLTGFFNYRVTFEPQRPPGTPPPSGRPRPPGLPPADTRSVFTALEQDLGFKLEAARERMEVLVIDRVERPSEN